MISLGFEKKITKIVLNIIDATIGTGAAATGYLTGQALRDYLTDDMGDGVDEQSIPSTTPGIEAHRTTQERRDQIEAGRLKKEQIGNPINDIGGDLTEEEIMKGEMLKMIKEMGLDNIIKVIKNPPREDVIAAYKES